MLRSYTIKQGAFFWTDETGHEHGPFTLGAAEEILNAEARRLERAARPAPADPGPARTTWSDSELAAKSARMCALNFAEYNRKPQ